MRLLERFFVFALAGAAAHCGGGASSTPPAAGPESAASTGAPASADSLPSGPEPAQSPELAAGIKAFDAGNFADARTAFDAAAKKNPKNYEALVDLGMACEKLGDPSAAEGAYKAALVVKPDLEGASVELSALYTDKGRLDEAIGAARDGLSKHPTSGPLHENLGAALAARGDQDGATKELTQAAQLTPNDPMVHFTLAHWLNVWKVRGAAPQLDAARDLAKDDYAMLASVAFEYRLAGELDACIKTYDRTIAMKDGGEVRTGRALCKLALKNDKGALEDLEAAVAGEPAYAQAHYYLAGRLAIGKHFKEAAAEYGKYLELAPTGSLAAAAKERKKAAEAEAAKLKKK